MQRIRGGPSSTAGPTGHRPELMLPAPALPASRLFRAGALVALAVVVSCLLVFTGAVGRPGLGAEVSNVVSPLVAALAAVCCGVAARRGAGRYRLAWGLLAVCCTCWFGAEASWVVRHPLPAVLPVGLDDLCYLTAIPFGVAALASFPSPHWRGADRFRAVLDGLIICSSVIFVSRGLGVLTPGVGSRSVQLVALAYPLGDVVMLSVVLVALVRATPASYAHLGLLVAAMGAYFVGDLVYALQIRADYYASGTPLDITWVLAYLLVALAALAPRSPVAASEEDGAVPYRGRTVPWLLVGGSLVALVVVAAISPVGFGGDPVMLVSCLVVLLLFFARQAWLFRDQSRANRQLLRESERRAQITGALLDGVLVLDGRGGVTLANPAAGTLLGTAPETLVGTMTADLVRPDETDPRATRELLAALLGHGVLTQVAATFVRTDGSALPVELSVGPLDRSAPARGVVVVFRDVTARRAVERMKNEFMSVISHELRTPLTSIRGAMALLDAGMGGSLEPTGARMVSIALRSSERISRLLNDILDVERLESGTLQLDLAEHDARTLVEGAVHEMGGLAAQADVAVVVGDAPGRVRADDDRVVQTLTNLIGNAVKFSAPGTTVTVSTRLVRSCPTAPTADAVEFSVTDQGRGIPADKLEAIFDRFEQVDSSDSRQHGGTGLGLAICRNIVRLHGGRIWATSTPTLGSVFSFVLPTGTGALPASAPPSGEVTGDPEPVRPSLDPVATGPG